MAMIGDNRMKNAENYRIVQEMFDPDVLQREYNFDNAEEHRSIDDHLETTAAFQEWASKRAEGMNLNPNMRRPVQVSDSPISDYDIQFTRYEKTNQSSLSNLSIPVASSASLTLNNCSTPNIPPNKSRKSSVYTPKDILRQKHMENCKNAMSKNLVISPKDSLGGFVPTNCSTPVTRRDRSIPRLAWSQRANKHSDDEREQENNPNSPDKTLTGNENAAEPEVPNILAPATQENPMPIETQQNDTIIPETQQNDSVIPETQDNEDTLIPETQEDQLPASQSVHIPETQEDDMPVTQDDVSTHPVQAQVTKQNTEQQAVPQETPSDDRIRIQARPPIRNQSQIPTPTTSTAPKSTPTTSTIPKSTPKTPSRLPVALRVPRLATTMSTNRITANLSVEPNIADKAASNAKHTETGRTVIFLAPSSNAAPSNQSSVVPSVVPAPNMTINVNVSNPVPQPLKETPKISRKHIGNAANATNGSDSSKPNSSTDSLMTNDEDSEGNARHSLETYDSPAETSRETVRRKLFSNVATESPRRSATFNKIDNLTRTINNGDTITSPNKGFGTRSINTTQPRLSNRNESDAIASKSQTFIKTKAPISNATFDVHAESASTYQQDANTIECSVSRILEPNVTEDSNDLGNVPSDALLDPIDLTDNDSDSHALSVRGDVTDRTNKSSKNGNKSNDEPKLTQQSQRNTQTSLNLDPKLSLARVKLNRLSTEQMNHFRNSIANQSKANVSNIRDSGAYQLPPPIQFENTNSSIIMEISPVTAQAKFNEPNESQSLDQSTKRKSKKRSSQVKINEDLIVVEEQINKIKEKSKKTRTSVKPAARTLRSVDSLHVNDEDETSENFKCFPNTSIPASTSTSTSDNASFKIPPIPHPRKSKRRPNSAAPSSAATAEVEGPEKLLEGRVAKVSIEQCASDLIARHTSKSNENESIDVHIDVRIHDNSVDDNINYDFDDEYEPAVPMEDPLPDKSTNQAERAQSSKTKAKPKPVQSSKTKAVASKKSNKSKVSDKPANETQSENLEITSATESTDVRRSRRNRILPFELNSRFAMYDVNPKPMKRKSEAVPAGRHTVSWDKRNPEHEPPMKKHRSRSENQTAKSRISNQSVKSATTSARSVKSVGTSARSVKSVGTSARSVKSVSTFSPVDDINIFTDPLKVSMLNRDWWKEIHDFTNKKPVLHNIDEVDVEHIKSRHRKVEVSFTHKVEYKERNGVDYGMAPASTKELRRFGFMRFQSKAVRPIKKNEVKLDLHVISGDFTLQCDGEDIEICPVTNITIPAGSRYGITNRGDDVGIIEFTYVE